MKLRRSTQTLALSLITVGALTACGPNFQSASKLSCTTNCGPSSSGDSISPVPEPNNDEAWRQMKVDGTVTGGRFDKARTIELDKANKQLVIRLPMLANPYIDGTLINGPIRQLPGASLSLEPLPQGGSALVLRIPLEHVLKGAALSSPSKLPNGDPLPGVPDGELPSLGIQLNNIKNIKATIYLGPTLVGLHVNTPFDPFIATRWPIRNADATRTWGYFFTLPAKPSVADGGFFLTFALPDDLARIIDNHL
jgi:hypothetical protein